MQVEDLNSKSVELMYRKEDHYYRAEQEKLKELNAAFDELADMVDEKIDKLKAFIQ